MLGLHKTVVRSGEASLSGIKLQKTLLTSTITIRALTILIIKYIVLSCFYSKSVRTICAQLKTDEVL